ncbi:MAG: HEAT repeat domain-containing protein [Acidobacteriota bacterium]
MESPPRGGRLLQTFSGRGPLGDGSTLSRASPAIAGSSRQGWPAARFLALAGSGAAVGLLLVAAAWPTPAGAEGRRQLPDFARAAGASTAVSSGAAAVEMDRSGYIGAEACKSCHADEYAAWKASRHSKMLQPATPAAVVAPFASGGSLRYGGRVYHFVRQGNRFFMDEEQPGLPPLHHKILYTLGNRRIQHYITKQPNGALVLLPPTWDVLRRKWFPLEEIVPTGEANVEPVQKWSKNCFGCHVSQERKNFDTESLTYRTDWLDFGTNCEACHGPGRSHAEFYLAGARGERRPSLYNPRHLKRPLMPFDGLASTELCASCHQNRYLMAAGYHPGEPFNDYFLTATMYTDPPDAPDPIYYADGRTRRFSNNSFGVWISRCFLEGQVRCLDCHRNPHSINVDDNSQLRPEHANAELCSRCHLQIVDKVEEHSHHPASSEGSFCLACHMPRTVTGIKATMRDHSLAVPVPENSRDYEIPNACNLCHVEEGPQWAAEKIRGWYGELEDRPAALRWRRRAAAFSAARANGPEALEPLLEMLRDPQEPFLLRAGAAGYLRQYAEEGSLQGLADALKDPHPVVRSVATLSVAANSEGAVLAQQLPPLLQDPSRTVRLNAALALARFGVGSALGTLGEQFRQAQAEYLQLLGLYADSAEDQFNRGAMLAVMGQPQEAAKAYRTALRLSPGHPAARFGLGAALLRSGKRQQGLEELRRLYRESPAYPGLEKLLSLLTSTPVPDNRRDSR